MTLNRSVRAAVAALALGAAGMVSAGPLVLTFEGIADNKAVGDFYKIDGVTFSPNTLAKVDADVGGTGNFANEPSPNTIMFFLTGASSILNYGAGFETGFSFYYSSSVATTVGVYSGLDGAGTLLGSIDLAAQHTTNCQGDPNGTFCNWTAAGIAFSGIAKSIIHLEYLRD